MSFIIDVYCGTRNLRHASIDLGDYAPSTKTGASNEEIEDALGLLKATMHDPSFIDDGCRNEDAVNGCIALHVLGYDPVVWFDNFFDDPQFDFFDSDIQKFEEHVERVAPYCPAWGPKGEEGRALVYSIR